MCANHNFIYSSILHRSAINCKRNEHDKLVTHYRGTWPFCCIQYVAIGKFRSAFAKRIDQQRINHSIYSAINKTWNNLLLASSLRNEHIRGNRQTTQKVWWKFAVDDFHLRFNKTIYARSRC